MTLNVIDRKVLIWKLHLLGYIRGKSSLGCLREGGSLLACDDS